MGVFGYLWSGYTVVRTVATVARMSIHGYALYMLYITIGLNPITAPVFIAGGIALVIL
jgi:hypothetical protein